MKKSIKVIAIILGVIVLVVAGIGGKMYMDEKKLQDEMVTVVKENKKIIDKELKAEDKYHKIKTITIDYSTVKHNPMGGIMFEGYVNDDQKLSFNAGFDKYIKSDTGAYGNIESTGVDITSELDEFINGGK